MSTESTPAKCGVIIDQSDRKDIECDMDSSLTNEGVQLCGVHAIAYYREGLLTKESATNLSKHVEEHPEIFLFR